MGCKSQVENRDPVCRNAGREANVAKAQKMRGRRRRRRLCCNRELLGCSSFSRQSSSVLAVPNRCRFNLSSPIVDWKERKKKGNGNVRRFSMQRTCRKNCRPVSQIDAETLIFYGYMYICMYVRA
jgi:hypothetical protein